MTRLDAAPTTRTGAGQRAIVVLGAVAAAVAVNLIVYGIGRLAGGDFAFTANGERLHVQPVTVAGFSAVPLGAGLLVVALLARIRWVPHVAMIVAPLFAIVTIGTMTIPADLDLISTLTLATCHLTLAPISVLAIRRLRPGPH